MCWYDHKGLWNDWSMRFCGSLISYKRWRRVEECLCHRSAWWRSERSERRPAWNPSINWFHLSDEIIQTTFQKAIKGINLKCCNFRDTFFSPPFEFEECWRWGMLTSRNGDPHSRKNTTPSTNTGADACCDLCWRRWVAFCFFQLLIVFNIIEELCVRPQHCCWPSSTTLTFIGSSHERMRPCTRGSGDNSASLPLRSSSRTTSAHLIISIKAAEFLLDEYQTDRWSCTSRHRLCREKEVEGPNQGNRGVLTTPACLPLHGNLGAKQG